MKFLLLFSAALVSLLSPALAGQEGGPLRILFLGHKAQNHPSDEYFPMLSQALGRDAIYFDYETSVEKALGDYEQLARYDGVLLYANHDTIEDHQYANLMKFVREGGGFIPVHCASFCFRNKMGFVKLVGGQFAHHQGKEFTPKIVKPDHPAMEGVEEFRAWDETYVHSQGTNDRDILMVREPEGDDNITEPEPWTWVRTEGKGRVFYTASGHDQRTWSLPAFHQLLKSGILWAVGDARQATYSKFLKERKPLVYEKRDNIPNYERRPEPLPFQLPLSPEDSMDYTQVPVGWKLELFASEPDVIRPISLAWDERGRLWVVETVDYPNEINPGRKGNDKIKILEDTDGDGTCDSVKVFAEGLNIPTSLVFANGGVYVHQAPDTLFLKDTDGDDRADVREVVLTGWGTGDTHAGPSNLHYGFDNQIWGAVGYSSFKDDTHAFGQGIYRFQKDGSGLEFLHQFNNNTWGFSFNEAGDPFGSTANANPSFFCAIPATALPDGRGQSATMIASSIKFHPITPNIRQVDVFGGYTSAAGHAFATSDAFPESWRGSTAFVAGPTGHLLGKFKIERDGAGYHAENDFALVASADEWFSPVAAEVGPDGNLWISDWYNFIIQHNPTPSPRSGGYQAENGRGNAHINPNRDNSHGRIYRLVWDKSPQPTTTSLADATTPQLLAALNDPNQFWRMTAQRLLVDGNKTDAATALKGMVAEPGIAAVHALWTLDGLKTLDEETHRSALLSTDPVLRRNAVRALPTDERGVALIFQSGVINDPDLTTRLAAFVALAQFPTTEPVKNAVAGLTNNPQNLEDPLLRNALKAASANHGVSVLSDIEYEPSGPNLLADAEWRPVTYTGSGGEHTRPEAEGVDGGPCFKISSKTGTDTSWQARVEVKPDHRYRLSAKIKSDGIRGGGRGILLNVHELRSPAVVTKSIKGDTDWTAVETDFSTEERDRISVNALYGGYGESTGTGWWDEIVLQELVAVARPDDGTEEKLEPGDAVRGREIFATNAVAACSVCHIVGGEGGVVGPALDAIASQKDADYIRESLLDPNAKIAENYPLTISPMPPMGLLLKPQEIEDILAYLQTLK